MRLHRFCIAAIAALLLPGCATVTRGTSQKFAIESTPPRADVALSTGQTCVTPCKLKLKRKHGFTATFTKPGYETYRAEVKSKFSGGGAAATAGNVLIGGLIGAALDGSSGALNNLTPNPLRVDLVPVPAGAPEASAPPLGSAPAAQPVPGPGEAGAPLHPRDKGSPGEPAGSGGER